MRQIRGETSVSTSVIDMYYLFYRYCNKSFLKNIYIINLDPWHPPSVQILDSVNHPEKIVNIFLHFLLRLRLRHPFPYKTWQRIPGMFVLSCVQWSPAAWWVEGGVSTGTPLGPGRITWEICSVFSSFTHFSHVRPQCYDAVQIFLMRMHL